MSQLGLRFSAFGKHHGGFSAPSTCVALWTAFCSHFHKANCFFALVALNVCVCCVCFSMSFSYLLLEIWCLPTFAMFSERWVLVRLHVGHSAPWFLLAGSLCEFRNGHSLLEPLFDLKKVPASPGSSHPRDQHGRLSGICLTPQLLNFSRLWGMWWRWFPWDLFERRTVWVG